MSNLVTTDVKAPRVDIQSLRAIAISFVVLFHLWPGSVTGGFIGVDVFFVISGFLITKNLIRDLDNGTFNLFKFWSKRLRRLLPASLTVLTVTSLTVIAVVPYQLWLQWLREIQASVLYVENWVLAFDSVDYLALSNKPSPTQHFWALSVEEQFNLFWPILIALAALLVSRKHLLVRRVSMLATISIVSISSFIYGMYLITSDPSIAYFSTPVRVWEFGIGALAAFIPAIRVQALRSLLAVVGLAVIVYAGVSFKTTLAFPGAWAVVPVIGTLLVIIGSANDGPLGKVFAFKPVQLLGDYSYSIYLWHWPLIILSPYVLGRDLDLWLKISLIAITLTLAFLTSKFIEKPFQHGGRVAQVRPSAVFYAVAATTLIMTSALQGGISQANNLIVQEKEKAEQIIESGIKCFGASARAPGKRPCTNPEIKELHPSLASAGSDFFWPNQCDATSREQTIPFACEVGNRYSKIKIALVGDSHAKQYASTLLDIAKKRSWSLQIIGKGRCPYSDARRDITDKVLSEACVTYVKNLKALLLENDYDLVITSQKNGVAWLAEPGQSQGEAAISGLVSIWKPLVDRGIPVIVIKDNPMPIPDVIRCLETKSEAECSVKRQSAIPFDPQVEAVKRMNSNLIRLVNFDNVYCDSKTCFPVIGKVVVYRDANHLTSTFARTLAPYLTAHMDEALAK